MPNIEDQLRDAARRSGLSIRQLALQAGLGYQSAHGFMTEGRGLTLAVAARLADLLDLELRPKRRRTKKG